MYDRRIDGELYDFGVSGKLIMNVLVMYDRQTQSYWSQLLGEAVEGPLKGKRLDFVTSWFTTWEAWRTRHPNTRALEKSSAYSDSYENNGYYSSDRTGIIPETFEDGRLDEKEFVIGVADDDSNAIAYSFSALRRDLLINDSLGDEDILVVFFLEADAGLVYNRRLGMLDEPMTFSNFDAQTGQMIDDQTGTVWDAWRGEAIEGELQGEVLRRMHSTRSFWFGWKDWYPNTFVYE